MTNISKRTRATASKQSSVGQKTIKAFNGGPQINSNSFILGTSQSSASIHRQMPASAIGFNPVSAANESRNNSRQNGAYNMHSVNGISSSQSILQQKKLQTPNSRFTGTADRRSTAMYSGAQASPQVEMREMPRASRQTNSFCKSGLNEVNNRGMVNNMPSGGSQQVPQPQQKRPHMINEGQMKQPAMAATRTSNKASFVAAQKPNKTSALFNRHLTTTKTANFWGELTLLAEKAGKIDSVDCRLNRQDLEGPATSLNTRQNMAPRQTQGNVRGQGGLSKNMFGVAKRDPEGSQYHEHVQEGRSMNAILQPDSAPQTRRAMTPQAGNNFIRSSNTIGSSAQMSMKKEYEDPANLIKPSKTFRKASEASMRNPLWTNDNDFDLYDKKMTKHELCKSRSRERYFQSSLSTLPGPATGLNCVKTRDQVQRDASENSNIARKKGATLDKVFASHISTLPGTHISSGQTQDAIEAKEQERQQRKYNDPSFKLRNEAFYGSYMMDKEKGRTSSVPREFLSHHKAADENRWSRAPSNVSTEARNRLLYQSNFKLE